MQRRLTVTLAGQDITLAATFGAGEEIMDAVADPLMITKENLVEMQLGATGMVYDARFKWNFKNVPRVIWAGMKAAGDKRDLRDVQQMVFDHGMIESAGIAMQFVMLLVTPTSEEASNEKGGGSGE